MTFDDWANVGPDEPLDFADMNSASFCGDDDWQHVREMSYVQDERVAAEVAAERAAGVERRKCELDCIRDHDEALAAELQERRHAMRRQPRQRRPTEFERPPAGTSGWDVEQEQEVPDE